MQHEVRREVGLVRRGRAQRHAAAAAGAGAAAAGAAAAAAGCWLGRRSAALAPRPPGRLQQLPAGQLLARREATRLRRTRLYEATFICTLKNSLLLHQDF